MIKLLSIVTIIDLHGFGISKQVKVNLTDFATEIVQNLDILGLSTRKLAVLKQRTMQQIHLIVNFLNGN